MKKIPEFKNEDEEFEFWSKADSTEYVDWSQAKPVKLVHLKPMLEHYLGAAARGHGRRPQDSGQPA